MEKLRSKSEAKTSATTQKLIIIIYLFLSEWICQMLFRREC